MTLSEDPSAPAELPPQELPPIEVKPPLPLWDKVILALLTVLPLIVYWRVGTFGFCNYDDPKYITGNFFVKQGFTLDALKYALTSTETGYWHPLAFLTHLLDVELYGMNAGGHHFTSLLIHTVNGVLLFWVLKLMTGRRWPSAWVAGMFALHPMHTESVAWIAERKDVLSGLCFMLTLWAYYRYTLRRNVGRYLLVTLGVAASICAKPMAVTLPAVLLLIDWWPLHHLRKDSEPQREGGLFARVGMLILEKIPWFAMGIAAGLYAIKTSRDVATFRDLTQVPAQLRLETAVIAYARYLKRFIWPTHLAVFYPYPDVWQTGKVVAAMVIVAACMLFAISQVRRRPYLFVGWFWFFGIMLPISGIFVVGDASMADRYTYLPYIGLCIAIAWTFAELPRITWAISGAIGSAGLAVLTVATFRHLPVWHDAASLMYDANLAVPNNWTAEINYGSAISKVGRSREAEPYFREAYRLKPNLIITNVNMARWYLEMGHTDEAVPYLNHSASKPPDADWLTLVGRMISAKGDQVKAIKVFQKALATDPSLIEAYTSLAHSQIMLGQLEEADQTLRESLRYSEDWPPTYWQLGQIAAAKFKADDAIANFQTAIDLGPEFGSAYLDYGILLANLGRYQDGLDQINIALEKLPPDGHFRRAQAGLTAGQISLRLNQPAAASDYFGKALTESQASVKESAEDPVSYYELAIVQQQLGQAAEARSNAVRSYEIAKKMNNVYAQQMVMTTFPALATEPSIKAMNGTTQPSMTQSSTMPSTQPTTNP